MPLKNSARWLGFLLTVFLSPIGPAALAEPPAVSWENVAAWASQAGLPAMDMEGLAQPAKVPGRPILALRGFFSLWSQACAPECGLPAPLIKNDPVALALELPEKAGEFRQARLERSYQVSGGTVQVRADFYALCPPAQDGSAVCQSRYFSVQVELSGAISAMCGADLNEADLTPFPVLVCGAPQSGRRLGVTLHRAALP
jgi:hypothetical protein